MKQLNEVSHSEVITVRNVRQLLFHIKNQDMTIAELRSKLIEVEDRHAIRTKDNIVWRTIE